MKTLASSLLAKRWRVKTAVAFAALVFGFSFQGSQGSGVDGDWPYEPSIPNLSRKICIGEEPTPIELPPISVGCGLIDCCPGCPAIDAPWPLDPKIGVTVSANLPGIIELEFLNLEAEYLEKIHFKNADPSGAMVRLNIGPEALIAMPSNHSGAVLISPRIKLIGSYQHEKKSDGHLPSRVFSKLQIDFRVFGGSETFSRFSYRLDFSDCMALPPDGELVECGDAIEISQGPEMPPAFVLLDAETEFGCLDDAEFMTTNRVFLGNVLAPVKCRSEIVVVSRDHAVTVLDDARRNEWNAWTNLPGNTQAVNLLAQKPQLPLNIVIALPEEQDREPRKTDAKRHLVAAQDILVDNYTGLNLESYEAISAYTFEDFNILENEEQIQKLTDLSLYALPYPYGVDFPSCGQENVENSFTIDDFEASVKAIEGAFDENKLNVYYLDNTFTGAHFRRCDNRSTQIIFIGNLAKDTSLMHEIGHALSLLHANPQQDPYRPRTHWDLNHDGYNDFSQENLMWGGADNRSHLSAGQVVRASLHEVSFINSGQFRSNEPVRFCTHSKITESCTWIGLDRFQP